MSLLTRLGRARLALVVAASTLAVLVPQTAYAAAPDTQIDSGPENGALVMPGTQVSYGFSSPYTVDHFECSVDDAAFATCTSPAGPYDLAVGGHSFKVRAVAPGNVVDATPAERIWTVRNVPCEQAGEARQDAQSHYFYWTTKKGDLKAKLQKAKAAHHQQLIDKYTKKLKKAKKKVRQWKATYAAAIAHEDAVC